jgi:hypothetical protein
VKNPRPRTAGVSATEHGRAQGMVQQLQARTEELEQKLVSTRQSLDEVSLNDLLRATAAKADEPPGKDRRCPICLG